ncbi:hypothetical protein BJY00DRAFT_19487 [Aspergillus carlsbadensis]|nr:hypothetical protein BJY00DRAFT_19487 [Aspergillus carlsbadensis]
MKPSRCCGCEVESFGATNQRHRGFVFTLNGVGKALGEPVHLNSLHSPSHLSQILTRMQGRPKARAERMRMVQFHPAGSSNSCIAGCRSETTLKCAMIQRLGSVSWLRTVWEGAKDRWSSPCELSIAREPLQQLNIIVDHFIHYADSLIAPVLVLFFRSSLIVRQAVRYDCIKTLRSDGITINNEPSPCGLLRLAVRTAAFR